MTDLRDDTYIVLLHTTAGTERYYRDKTGWIEISTRGRAFRATSEQVLDHLLPALAGVAHATVRVAVEHHEGRQPATVDA
jgi:hypothetical protein